MASTGMRSSWIDITVPLYDGMVHWPGDPPVRVTRIKALERGDPATVSRLSLGSHTGTHVDAPGHFLRGGRTVDQLPWEALIGPARVVAMREAGVITPAALAAHRIRRGERILLKTRNSARCWWTSRFVKNFVALSVEAARWLARRKIRTVGVDYLSVGSYRARNGIEVHRALLGAGIGIVEGLNLSRVRPGTYEFVCLPLRLRDGDGAPARAVLRPLKDA